jgi:inhibitor of cysteine peptidase
MSEQYIYLTSTKYIADAQITSIHKIFVSKSKIIPMADGQVNGYVNNQFSLDEYNGTLRIATTETEITGVPTNNVFCLDKYLNVIGSLGNIALNETIFSARYVDKRLYLVTFRRIDPFFVIDLSDHTHPSILG